MQEDNKERRKELREELEAEFEIEKERAIQCARVEWDREAQMMMSVGGPGGREFNLGYDGEVGENGTGGGCESMVEDAGDGYGHKSRLSTTNV